MRYDNDPWRMPPIAGRWKQTAELYKCQRDEARQERDLAWDLLDDAHEEIARMREQLSRMDGSRQ